jgi:hypothetical protein
MDDELKVCGRKLLWPSFKIVKWNFAGGIKKNHANPQSVSPVPRSRFEPGTLKMRVGSVTA